jgi:hypothetical protein
VCLVAFDSIIKQASEIIESSEDNRERLQAMQMFRDTHQLKLELLSNATTIDHALEYIRTKQREQEKQEHKTNDDIAAAGKQSVF